MGRTLMHGIAGIAAFLFACEVLFRILPVSTTTQTGYYFDPAILSYPPHHAWRMSIGWDLRHPQEFRSNNFGYVSDHEFVPDPTAVALVGDSFVEANYLDAADRPGARLERALGGRRKVYAMGSPGTALLDYAERIRFAYQRFGIRDFVVLMERGDVRQSLCGSGNIHSPCLDPGSFAARTELHAPPSMAKRLLRHSALAQYVFGQLNVRPETWRRAFRRTGSAMETKPIPVDSSASAKVAERDAKELAAVDAVTAAFFERVRPFVTGRLVIVVDGDRRGAGVDDVARRRFISLARAAGALVVDATPIFRAHYAVSTLSLDNSPTDGHFNPLGVRLIVTAAADTLLGSAE